MAAVADQLRIPDREQWVIVLVRLGVVGTAALFLAFGPQAARAHTGAAAGAVAVAIGYAVLLALWRLRDWPPLPTWATPLADSVLSLTMCGLTGGADSPLVAILPLVVIAAGLSGPRPRRGLPVAVGLGAGYTLTVLLGTPSLPVLDRLMIGLWWTGYLAATAVLVGVFTRLVTRQYELAAQSRAEAIAEHAALLEERDLRRRLLESQQSRQDGLRVILHEFRTPVTSMTALSRDLGSGALAEPAAATAASLISAHAVHLRDMLDNLADLAIADGSPVGRPRERRVVLSELAEAVMDAAGVDPARRRSTVSPPEATVSCDPQRLRRILTNLTENAARHAALGPVELRLEHTPGRLVAEVRDRGPGLPAEQLGEVTRSYVSLGDRRGTTGLGLWIVEQLVSGMGGRLTLTARDGGGLVARLVLPLEPR